MVQVSYDTTESLGDHIGVKYEAPFFVRSITHLYRINVVLH